MCLEEMKCRTCSTFFLLSSLSRGDRCTPCSTSPAARRRRRRRRNEEEKEKGGVIMTINTHNHNQDK